MFHCECSFQFPFKNYRNGDYSVSDSFLARSNWDFEFPMFFSTYEKTLFISAILNSATVQSLSSFPSVLSLQRSLKKYGKEVRKSCDVFCKPDKIIADMAIKLEKLQTFRRQFLIFLLTRKIKSSSGVIILFSRLL